MPQVSLNAPLDEMAISAIVELYNEFAEKPVKSFRDKPTAIARLQKLGIDLVEPGSKIEATSDSPGMRRMAEQLGPTKQEALRTQVLGRPGSRHGSRSSPPRCGYATCYPYSGGLCHAPCNPP
jgi:hypothetical protein